MNTFLLILSGVSLASCAALLGMALLLLGFVKNRSLWRRWGLVYLSLGIALGLATSTFAAAKVLHHAAKLPGAAAMAAVGVKHAVASRAAAAQSRAWGATVDLVEETSFTFTPLDPNQLPFDLGKRPELHNIQGLASEGVLLNSYYFRYQADKQAVLDIVSNLTPLESGGPWGDINFDSQCKPISYEAAAERFNPCLESSKKPLIKSPFWHPETIAKKECFECFKIPYTHTIMFDESSKTVYHVIEEARP